jgi:hypothetical protein
VKEDASEGEGGETNPESLGSFGREVNVQWLATRDISRRYTNKPIEEV